MISSCMIVFPSPKAAKIARRPPTRHHRTMSRWCGSRTPLMSSPGSNPLFGAVTRFRSRKSRYSVIAPSFPWPRRRWRGRRPPRNTRSPTPSLRPELPARPIGLAHHPVGGMPVGRLDDRREASSDAASVRIIPERLARPASERCERVWQRITCSLPAARRTVLLSTTCLRFFAAWPLF